MSQKEDTKMKINLTEALLLVVLVAASIFSVSALAGCGPPPVERSQTIMIETATALASVDRTAARAAEYVRDGALERVEARSVAECEPVDSSDAASTLRARQACFVALLREEMQSWFDLLDGLETAHEFLEVWEAANDGWRESGEQPPDWNQRICIPLRETVQAIVRLLQAVGVDIPQPWSSVISRADLVCSIGVGLATAIAGSEAE